MTTKHMQARAADLRAEVSRIMSKTLHGSFANPEDRAYWEQRLKKLNGELSALEEQLRPNRKVFHQ